MKRKKCITHEALPLPTAVATGQLSATGVGGDVSISLLNCPHKGRLFNLSIIDIWGWIILLGVLSWILQNA